jgi:uncharacterized protein
MTKIIDKYYENRKLHADEIFEYLEESIGEDLFKAYLGDSRAQFKVGTDKKDAKWMLKSAENGNSAAQNTIGVWYNLGRNGVIKNIEIAKEWYFESIKSNYPTAFSNIAHLYKDGLGFDKDVDMAIEYYEKSIELGCARGSYYLGMMYYKGEGVEADIEKAFKLFEKSAEKGFGDAMYRLSIMYAKGDHVAKDIKTSFEYLLKASEKDSELAKNKLAQLTDDF